MYIHIIRQRFAEVKTDGNTQPLTDEGRSTKDYCPPLFIAPLFAVTL